MSPKKKDGYCPFVPDKFCGGDPQCATNGCKHRAAPLNLDGSDNVGREPQADASVTATGESRPAGYKAPVPAPEALADLMTLFQRFESAHENAWVTDCRETVSNKRLKEVWDKNAATKTAFVEALRTLQQQNEELREALEGARGIRDGALAACAKWEKRADELQRRLEAREPMCLGREYRTRDGRTIRLMTIHNEGSYYETMADEDGHHYYSRRWGDLGRGTGCQPDHPGNLVLASPAGEAREGWVSVPKEPTQAMLRASWNAATTGRSPDEDRVCWRAMLSALPEEPK